MYLKPTNKVTLAEVIQDEGSAKFTLQVLHCVIMI